MLAADGGPDRLRRRRHGDAARPAAAAGGGARRPRRRARIADPARRLATCARASPATAGCSARSSTCSHRSGSSARSRTRSAGSRASRARPRTTSSRASRSTSIVFDVELIYLARRRGYSDGDRADPLGRPARLAHARAPGPRPAGRVGPLPHPAHPSADRAGRRRQRDLMAIATSSAGSAARPCRSSRSSSSPCGRRGRRSRVAGDTLGFDFLAYHQAARRLLDGSPLYDMSTSRRPAGSGSSTTRRPFVALILPFGAPVRDDRGLDLDRAPRRGLRSRGRRPAGVADGALVDRAAGRAVVAVRLRDQARPGRAAPVPALRRRLALAGRPDPARRERGARHARSSCSRGSSSSGRC